MDISVNVTDNSKEVLDALKEQIALAMEAVGETAEGYAKDGCPVDTGRLRNSITYATKDYTGSSAYADDEGNSYDDGGALSAPEEGTVYIGSNVEYAEKQEEGEFYKHVVGGAHFLRNAIQNNTKEYENIIKTILET